MNKIIFSLKRIIHKRYLSFGQHLYAEKLYPEHIITTGFQKVLLSLGSSAQILLDPSKGEMLATFGETSGKCALKMMRKKMMMDADGRRILRDCPLLNSSTVDLKALNDMPVGSLGKEYTTWLLNNSAHPNERLPVIFVDDVDLAYVMTRYRQIHDLCHVILGMQTNMIGEVTVKIFEGIQTGLPMCITGGVLGMYRLKQKHLRLYLQTHLIWAIKQGFKGNFLMNFYFEENWNKNIADLRQQLIIEVPPYTPMKSKSKLKASLDNVQEKAYEM